VTCEVCHREHDGRGRQCAPCADFDRRWSSLTFDEKRAEIAEMDRHTETSPSERAGSGEREHDNE
jgi:hypothetical protein